MKWERYHVGGAWDVAGALPPCRDPDCVRAHFRVKYQPRLPVMVLRRPR